MSKIITSGDVCIMVHPLLDNVAVAKRAIMSGTRIAFPSSCLYVRHKIDKGQRFAVRSIAKGCPVVQYGSSFGISRGISAGT